MERFSDWTMKRFMEEESISSPMTKPTKNNSLQKIVSKLAEDTSIEKDNNINIILTALKNTSYEDEGVKLAVEKALEDIKTVVAYLEKNKDNINT